MSNPLFAGLLAMHLMEYIPKPIPKKCFRKECNKLREHGYLYCSALCSKLDNQKKEKK